MLKKLSDAECLKAVLKIHDALHKRELPLNVQFKKYFLFFCVIIALHAYIL
jgi:hypothetical protein